MINTKLNKYKVQGITFAGDVIKTEYILANSSSDAMIIFIDKYCKMINKQSLDIRCTLYL